MLGLAKAKEKALMALSVRRLIERGWLTALLRYLIKREELSVRLKYIGDVRLLGHERERLRAFEHIILETHPHITGVSNDKLLASLKELGFECRLHMVHDPKLGVNIYRCKNSKLRQLNRTF